MSKIMIVDDEAVIAFELETTLSTMGYDVVGTAGSGAEAVEMAMRLNPDLVLMDIMMPGEMDGIEAAEKIRAVKNISVVFLTAYAGDAYVERAKHVEPFGYLIKPFHDEQVKAAIEIALYKKKMAQQLEKQQHLNKLLMDSLPHPAMLISHDRTVLAANRKAIEAGTEVNDYCWKSFGKCAHIPDGDQQYIMEHPGSQLPHDTKCSFCLADEAMAGKHASNNPEVEAFDRLWDTYWVPIDDQTYLHYAIDITERKKMEAALRQSRDELEKRVTERTTELKALSAKLLEVQETERKRIAGDLHDSIGQILAALKFGVENAIHEIHEARIETDISVLQALVPVAQQACDEVRRIHTDLRPPMLDDIGILSTISWFCRELQSLCRGVRIKKQIDIAEDLVPDDLKIVIFRIIQEALNNAVKHADPSEIEVALDGHGQKIALLIRDNGQGFDPHDKQSREGGHTGFGLSSMKERAQLSGGSFSILSKPGEGTVLEALWPIPS